MPEPDPRLTRLDYGEPGNLPGEVDPPAFPPSVFPRKPTTVVVDYRSMPEVVVSLQENIVDAPHSG